MDNSDIDCGGFLQFFEEFFSWEPLLIIQLIILLTNWSLFVTWLLNRSLTHYGDRDLLKKQSYFLLFKLNCRNPHLVSSSNPDNLNNHGSDSDQQSCHVKDKLPLFRRRNYLVSEGKYFTGQKYWSWQSVGRYLEAVLYVGPTITCIEIESSIHTPSTHNGCIPMRFTITQLKINKRGIT